MKVELGDLQDGAFTGPPVQRLITWEIDGQPFSADVYVRRLSYYAAVSDVRALSTEGDIAAHRIASSITDENGKQVFKPEDVTGAYSDGTPVLTTDVDGRTIERGAMHYSLAMALLAAIAEVNKMGKSPT